MSQPHDSCRSLSLILSHWRHAERRQRRRRRRGRGHLSSMQRKKRKKRRSSVGWKAVKKIRNSPCLNRNHRSAFPLARAGAQHSCLTATPRRMRILSRPWSKRTALRSSFRQASLPRRKYFELYVYCIPGKYCFICKFNCGIICCSHFLHTYQSGFLGKFI